MPASPPNEDDPSAADTAARLAASGHLVDQVEDARRVIADAAGGLVERLEAAASVHTDAAADLQEALREDIERTRMHLREGILEGAASVREEIRRTGEEAAATLQADIAAVTAKAHAAVTDIQSAADAINASVAGNTAAAVRIEASQQRIADGTDRALEDAAAQFTEAARIAAGMVGEHVDDALADSVIRLGEQLKTATGAAADVAVQRSAGFTDELRDAVRQAQHQLGDAVQSAVHRLEAASTATDQEGRSSATRIVTEAGQSVDRLQQVLDDAVTAIGRASTSVDAVDVRLVTAAGRVETVAEAAATRLERLGEAALSRVITDVGELMAGLQASVAAAEQRLLGVADHVGERIDGHLTATATTIDDRSQAAVRALDAAVQAAVADVDRRVVGVAEQATREVSAHTGRLSEAADELVRTTAVTAAQLTGVTDVVTDASATVLQAGADGTAVAAQLEVVAERFAEQTGSAVERTTAVTETMVQRFADAVDAAGEASSRATAGNLETLTTAVAWASRTLQELVERFVDDLKATTAASVQRVEGAGGAAHDRLQTMLEAVEQRLAHEVGRTLSPLTIETGRVAEQQAGLAATASEMEALMAQREAESVRRDAAAERMEAAVAAAADLVAAGTRQLREDQAAAADGLHQIVAGLAEGTDRAASLIAELSGVTGRLEAATAAADASRRALQQVVTRAEELAADAAARRRRAPTVPPPTG
ncbi:hypothetical protein BH23ACT9_BH23ACT9_26300 [soil metagenome]